MKAAMTSGVFLAPKPGPWKVNRCQVFEQPTLASVFYRQNQPAQDPHNSFEDMRRDVILNPGVSPAPVHAFGLIRDHGAIRIEPHQERPRLVDARGHCGLAITTPQRRSGEPSPSVLVDWQPVLPPIVA